jgi:hypothetical protein
MANECTKCYRIGCCLIILIAEFTKAGLALNDSLRI